MFLLSFLVLTSIYSCCRPASWEILLQEHSRIGLQAGKGGRGDTGTVTGTASFGGRGKKGRGIQISKQNWFHCFGIHLHLISFQPPMLKINISLFPQSSVFLSSDDCKLPCEIQELSGSSSPPHPTLFLWQTGRCEHETEWKDSIHQMELKQNLMWQVWQHSEIVSLCFLLPPGCSPHLFGSCPTFLPEDPMGLVSADHCAAGFQPSCAESQVIPYLYTDPDSLDLILTFHSMLKTQCGVETAREVTRENRGSSR